MTSGTQAKEIQAPTNPWEIEHHAVTSLGGKHGKEWRTILVTVPVSCWPMDSCCQQLHQGRGAAAWPPLMNSSRERRKLGLRWPCPPTKLLCPWVPASHSRELAKEERGMVSCLNNQGILIWQQGIKMERLWCLLMWRGCSLAQCRHEAISGELVVRHSALCLNM